MQRLLLLCLGLLLAAGVRAAPAEPPPIAARAWYLVDANSGAVLAAHNEKQMLEPASLTKLMTAWLVFDALRTRQLTLQTVPTFSLKAVKAAGARLPLDPSRPANVEQLLQGMIILSANDAAVQLAEAVAGSEEAFVVRMNERAASLGLANTRFRNATGQPEAGHLSSARDMALLAASLIREFPQYYPWYGQRTFVWNGTERRNSNLLLWRDPTVDGMKTGTTRTAGYCMVASAARGERRVIAVVLGASSEEARAIEAQKLLNYGMQAWETVRVYARDQRVAQVPVWQGLETNVELRAQQAVHITVPAGASGRLKARLLAQQPLLAPVRRGQALGRVVITLDGKVVSDFPVVAAQSVARSGWVASSWDRLRLWWNKP